MISKLLSLLCFILCIGQRDLHGDGPLPKPTLSAWPSSVVPAKSNVTLRCSSPIPGVDFILRKGNAILDTRQPLDSTEKTAEFHLTGVGLRSVGPYACECSRRGSPAVVSQPSSVLLLLVTGNLPPPSLQAHQVGKVTAGGEVTLQCRMPNSMPTVMIMHLVFALLKAGAPSPVQLRRRVGKETDFSLQGMTVNDTGNYSCIYYQTQAPFWASDPSHPLEILVTVSPNTTLQGYTSGNLIRLGVAAVILVTMGLFLLEAWHGPKGAPSAAGLSKVPVSPA